jgi:RHS repeat-associated protein
MAALRERSWHLNDWPGLAAHLETVAIGSGASQIDFTTADDGRLSEVARSFEIESEPVTDDATFAYDGRSFLCRVENAISGSEDVEYVEAVYSSEGLLHGLTRVEFVPVGDEGETEPRTTEFSVFYFAGRPVAQVKELDSTTEWMFLTTDHLGTPLLSTDLGGNDLWAGPFEPFGTDFFQLAQPSDVFLRLPGQWNDPIWQNPTAGAGIYYNVHRWYEYGTGRYGRADPTGYEGSPLNWYLYAEANPLLHIDPLGLTSYKGFPPGKRQQIERAVERAKEGLKDGCCAGNAAAPLLRQLEQATIVYRPRLNLCGRVTFWGKLTNKIQLGDPAFDFARCCLLESTVAHEANHLRWNDGGEDPSRQIEQKCFGCG